MENTVLTGVSRVAKESIFSGANNFDVYTVLDDEFSDDFVITSEKIDTAENFYHAFVLGMLVSLKDTYVVNSNRESGIARYDIMLEPKDKTENSFIMKFKVF